MYIVAFIHQTVPYKQILRFSSLSEKYTTIRLSQRVMAVVHDSVWHAQTRRNLDNKGHPGLFIRIRVTWRVFKKAV